MSRSAESRKLLREMHRAKQAQQQQASLAFATQIHNSQNAIYSQSYGFQHGSVVSSAYGHPSLPFAPTGKEKEKDKEKANPNVVPMNPNISLPHGWGQGLVGSSVAHTLPTFNLNTMLHQNILQCDYFKALHVQLLTYQDVVQEIKAKVLHVEPWERSVGRGGGGGGGGGTSSVGAGGLPSTAFCLLLQLLAIGLTYKQLKQMLVCRGHPYVRAIGLLYLRYSCVPAHVFRWFEPFLEDGEVFQPEHGPGGVHRHLGAAGAGTGTGAGAGAGAAHDGSRERAAAAAAALVTVGHFARRLLQELVYFGTPLPRIPTALERRMQLLLSLIDARADRRKSNLAIMRGSDGASAFDKGTKVYAVWVDADQGPMWCPAAVVDAVDPAEEGDADDAGTAAAGTAAVPHHHHCYYYYRVRFDGQDEPARVDLGDMQLMRGAEYQEEAEAEAEAEAGKKRARLDTAADTDRTGQDRPR